MTIKEFEEYTDKLIEQDYIVKIKMKYSCEDDYEYTNEVLTVVRGRIVWLYDWWEGQQDVEVLGCIPVDDVEVPNRIIGGENE